MFFNAAGEPQNVYEIVSRQRLSRAAPVRANLSLYPVKCHKMQPSTGALAPQPASHADGASTLEQLSLTPDADLARFGMNLRRLREARLLSRAALGHQIGTSGKAIEHWEEATGNPPIRYLVRLSRFFDMSLDDLVGIADEEHEKSKLALLLKLHAEIDKHTQRLDKFEEDLRRNQT